MAAVNGKEFDQLEMTIGEAKDLLKLIIPSKVPVFLHGTPGIGKSDVVRQAAAEMGIGFTDIRVATLDPVDIRGLPSVTGGQTKWNPPDFFPTEGRGILFLDELPQGAKAVQGALLQLCLDRRVGDYVLPDGWYIVAAGNRVEDRAGVNQIITPLLNRFTHIDCRVSADEWLDWAADADVDHRIMSYIRNRKDKLDKFKPDGGRAQATPRSWFMLSRILKGYKIASKDGKDTTADTVVKNMAKSTIGEEAVEFIAFLRNYVGLPSAQEIADGKDVELIAKDNVGKTCALLGACFAVIKETEPKDDAFGNCLKYFEKISDENVATLMKMVTSKYTKFAGNKEFLAQGARLRKSGLFSGMTGGR